MSYIRFRSANTEMSKIIYTGAAARRCDCASFDGVTQCGACAMRLVIGDKHLERVRASGAQQGLLCLAVWRGEAGAFAILSHRRALELPTADALFCAKQSGSASLTTAETVRTGVERMRPPTLRCEPACCI